MNEREWVETIARKLPKSPGFKSGKLGAHTGLRLPYGCEIREYKGNQEQADTIRYQTDLLIVEATGTDTWIPRVVIEAKFSRITTHDAITYSQKAAAHRSVHPYLRYGIMLGNWGEAPLPGRLFRHGQHFDFMFSFKGARARDSEWKRFLRLVKDEVRASRATEQLTYGSRLKDRDRYTLLHRKLVLE